MIKVEEEQNTYTFRQEDADKIISKIENMYVEYCTQEEAREIADLLKQFLDNIKVNKETVEVEKHETEEQAREYFGEDFIKEFNQLLHRLDDENTILYLHGTSPEVCPSIMEQGLNCRSCEINGTACGQTMPAGNKDYQFSDFESLLNWGHKNYKGLAMIAVPYESFYKEGLWNNHQDTSDSGYLTYDYKINPDFIVGYIDVNTKQITLNPKYNREHNYEGLVKDSQLYHPFPDMDNDKFKEALGSTPIDDDIELPKLREERTKPNAKHVLYNVSDIPGVVRSMEASDNNTLSQDKYDYFSDLINRTLNDLVEIIPELKTQQQVDEENRKYDVFATPSIEEESGPSDVDKFFDNLEWEEPIQKM